jgi:hypothetical protein
LWSRDHNVEISRILQHCKQGQASNIVELSARNKRDCLLLIKQRSNEWWASRRNVSVHVKGL